MVWHFTVERNGIDPFLFYYETFNKGYAYSEDGVSILLNDDAAEKFEKFCSPYLKGYAPADSINWSYSEMVDNFVGGLCGTFWNDSEVAAILLEEMDESQWTVLPVPRSDVDEKCIIMQMHLMHMAFPMIAKPGCSMAVN